MRADQYKTGAGCNGSSIIFSRYGKLVYYLPGHRKTRIPKCAWKHGHVRSRANKIKIPLHYIFIMNILILFVICCVHLEYVHLSVGVGIKMERIVELS